MRLADEIGHLCANKDMMVVGAALADSVARMLAQLSDEEADAALRLHLDTVAKLTVVNRAVFAAKKRNSEVK